MLLFPVDSRLGKIILEEPQFVERIKILYLVPMHFVKIIKAEMPLQKLPVSTVVVGNHHTAGENIWSINKYQYEPINDTCWSLHYYFGIPVLTHAQDDNDDEKKKTWVKYGWRCSWRKTAAVFQEDVIAWSL